MQSQYLLNRWYQLAFSHEVGSVPFARTILDQPIVAFRTSGGIRVLDDVCPHRFAPLSTGRLENDVIICGYHGIGFDGAGRCAVNPHGPRSSALSVRSYAVVERNSVAWVWAGDPAEADASLIPDLSFIDATPESARIYFTIPIKANYRLMNDNLLDLSHADYLHPTSLGGVMTGIRPRTEKTAVGVAVEWVHDDVLAPPRFHAMVPPPQRANAWTRAEWQAPAVMVIKTALYPSSRERTRQDEIWALHSMTPETDGTTHYFVCGTRRNRTDDAEYSAQLRQALEHAFVREDKPMLEDQQVRLGNLPFELRRPALLPIDAGSVTVRRALDRMIAEQAKNCPDTAPSANTPHQTAKACE